MSMGVKGNRGQETGDICGARALTIQDLADKSKSACLEDPSSYYSLHDLHKNDELYKIIRRVVSGQVDEMFTMFYLYNVNASVDCELVVHTYNAYKASGVGGAVVGGGAK